MKYLFYFISFIFPALCSSAQPAERDSSIYIASSRLYRMGESLVVSMQVDITRQIPSNESVILVPRLSDSLDNFIQLPAIYVNGRKQHIFFQRETGRQEKDYEELRRRNDRKQSVHYLRSIPFTHWMKHASLHLIEKECGCGVPRHTDSAYLDFPLNETTIYPEYRNNPAELAKIKRSIDLIKNDTNVVISHIDIHGYASPEGPYSNNERLARERTRTLKDYVCGQYAFNDTLFTTHYTPEDWDGFVKLLTDTVITHREELLHIAESKSSPDGKERKIRKRYPEEFRFILQHWFPGLRHSDYTIHYVVRPFTVEQAKQVFQSNPKNLSIEEMFRIARTYPAGSPEYNKIFMTAVLLNPEHPVANLNAACILLSQGDTKGASLYLDKAGETPEKTLLQGIMQMLNGNYTEAENLLHKAEEAGLPQAGENLKILHEIY
mgnify:CR=1 FL=1